MPVSPPVQKVRLVPAEDAAGAATTAAGAADAAKYDGMKEYDIVKKATLSHAYKPADPSKDIPADTQYAPSDALVDVLYSESEITATTDPITNVTTYTQAESPEAVDFGEGRKQARRIAYFTNDYAKTLYENRVYLELQDKDEDGYLNIGAKVVYEFTIEALDSSAPIYYHITANLFNTKIFDPDPTPDNQNPLPVRIQDAFEVQIFDVSTSVPGVGEGAQPVVTPTDQTAAGIEPSAKVSAPARDNNDTPTATLTNWRDGIIDTTGDGRAIQPGATRTIQVVYTVKDMDGATELYQGISYTMKSLQLGDIYIKLANNGKNITDLPNYAPGIDGTDFDKFVDWITGKEEKPEISDPPAEVEG